ncbi:hypothetical protein L1281_002285 [Neisseria sp. HSC-16F19]|nr:hypothetical protein [Neisseria sp. HSC-16F19]
MFEIIDQSKNVRRLLYAVLLLIAYWRLPEILAVVFKQAA